MNCRIDLTRGDCVVLYGRPGAGKTCLLRTIEEYLRQRGLDVVRCSALELVDCILKSIRNRSYEAYQSLMLAHDALLIDDIWILDGKPATARAVLSLITAAAGNERIVVITSDLSPSQIAGWANSDALAKHLRVLPVSRGLWSGLKIGIPPGETPSRN